MKKNIILLLILLPGMLSCTDTTGSNLRKNVTTNDAVHANINLGVEYMRVGSYEKALDRLERARQIDPGYYETYNMLGMLYQQLGEMDDADRSFRKALSLNSNDPSTLNNYGQLMFTMKQYDRAIELFMRAASNPLYETPEIAYYNAGRCAQAKNDLTAAEKYYRRALELNKTMSEALIRMSELSYENKNYLSARGYLERYLENARHTAKSLWLGIQIEQKLGDTDAVSSYALLLRNTFPDSKEAALLEQSGVR